MYGIIGPNANFMALNGIGICVKSATIICNMRAICYCCNEIIICTVTSVHTVPLQKSLVARIEISGYVLQVNYRACIFRQYKLRF